MADQAFSVREGFREEAPLIYEDAPESLRYGLREVLTVLRYRTPNAQRRILCQAFRIMPDQGNWSDSYIDDEVIDLISTEPWYRFFDALERIPLSLPEQRDVPAYYKAMNELFADEQMGYRFESDRIIRVGTQEFHDAVTAAQHALQDERFLEPRKQFEKACGFRNKLPPDWENAIKDAVNSVEGVLQVIYRRYGVALPTIVSENLPSELPGGIKKLLAALYSLGSGTTGARHASIGGNQSTGPRAELAIHTAAALHAFAIAELDTSK